MQEVILGIIPGVALFALLCVDWWVFNQKFPHASFWAWVLSPR